MELIILKPCDTTFFREGTNFDLGTSGLISSRNIPYPSTFFGAVFTAILSTNEELKRKFLKYDKLDHEKILKIGQIYIFNKKQNLIYIPCPKDVYITNEYLCKNSVLKKVKKDECSLKLDYYFEEPEGIDVEKADKYYIYINDFFEKYRIESIEKSRLKKEEDIFCKNNKIGIGINYDNKIINDGMYYILEQTEFKDDLKNEWCYLVEYNLDKTYLKNNYLIENINSLGKGFLKLGGESKICMYEKINNIYATEYRSKVSKLEDFKISDKIKVILTSDSYFEENIESIFNDDKIKLLAISNDKPIYIGGYDMKNKDSKSGSIRRTYKGYGAGTVLVFEINLEIMGTEIINYFKKKIGGNNAKGFNQYIILKEEE